MSGSGGKKPGKSMAIRFVKSSETFHTGPQDTFAWSSQTSARATETGCLTPGRALSEMGDSPLRNGRDDCPIRNVNNNRNEGEICRSLLSDGSAGEVLHDSALTKSQGDPGSALTKSQGDPGSSFTKSQGDPGSALTKSQGAPGSALTKSQGDPGSTLTKSQGDPGSALTKSQGDPGSTLTKSQGDPGSALTKSQGDPGSTLTKSQGDPGSALTKSQGDTGSSLTKSQGDPGSALTKSQGDPGSALTKSQGDPGSSLTKSQGDSGSALTKSQGDPGSSLTKSQRDLDSDMHRVTGSALIQKGCSQPQTVAVSRTPEAKPILSKEEYQALWKNEQDEKLEKFRKLAYEVVTLKTERPNAKDKIHSAANRVPVHVDFHTETVPGLKNNNFFVCHMSVHGVSVASGQAARIKDSKTNAYEAALQKILMPHIRIVRLDPERCQLEASREPFTSPPPEPSPVPLSSLSPTASTSEKVKSPVSTSEKVKSPVSTSEKVESSLSTSEKVKSSVGTSEKVKSSAGTSEKVKSSLSTSEKVKSSLSMSEKVKPLREVSCKLTESNMETACLKRRFDERKSLEDFVIVEPLVPTPDCTPAHTLRRSADFNHMLLEYEYIFKGEAARCTLKLEDQVLADINGVSKLAAKNQASAQALAKLKNRCWVLQTKKAVDSDTKISKDEMLNEFVGYNEQSDAIGWDNVGNKLLRKMGWAGGGVGKDGSGIVEPVTLKSVLNREGLGLGATTGITQDFKTRVKDIIENYAASGNQEDLVFDFDFRLDERQVIHNESRRLNLRSKCRGRGRKRYLCVRRKLSANELFDHVMSRGGETARYVLVPPGQPESSSDSSQWTAEPSSDSGQWTAEPSSDSSQWAASFAVANTDQQPGTHKRTSRNDFQANLSSGRGLLSTPASYGRASWSRGPAARGSQNRQAMTNGPRQAGRDRRATMGRSIQFNSSDSGGLGSNGWDDQLPVNMDIDGKCAENGRPLAVDPHGQIRTSNNGYQVMGNGNLLASGAHGNQRMGYGRHLNQTMEISNYHVGSGSYGNQDMGSGSYGNQDMGSGSYGKQDMGSGSYGNQDMGSGSYCNQDIGGGSYVNQDMGSGSYGNQDMGSGSYGNQDMGNGYINMGNRNHMFENYNPAIGRHRHWRF